ncbi:MAG: ABC transporter permease [Treponema sp.]|nr:ABC transporter permease [Treponema sp.]
MPDETSEPEFKSESRARDVWDHLRKNPAALFSMTVIALLALLALAIYISGLLGFRILPYDPNVSDLTQAFLPPSGEHWFGTDQLGRDIFCRILDGTKISLSVGISAVTISIAAGTILGALAGYFGGWGDNLIMRCMDIMFAVPSILLAITFMAAMGRGIDKAVFAIGIVSIPEYARIVRGNVLFIKENDFVRAARVSGADHLRIIFVHILPNIISPIIVRATLGISTAVLDTAALGFLGLGVQPPFAEWGDMLGRSRGYIFSSPYTLIFPGLAITLTVLAFNLLGDSLRDALDPRK